MEEETPLVPRSSYPTETPSRKRGPPVGSKLQDTPGPSGASVADAHGDLMASKSRKAVESIGADSTVKINLVVQGRIRSGHYRAQK